MAILGDFAFYAGNPSEELVKYKPESCKQDFIIMVPQNASWAELIEKCYGDKAKKVTRYAIKKEMDIFDSVIGSIVTVTVDRPLGSCHPEHKDMYDPINYGYVEDIMALDGEEQYFDSEIVM